MRRVLAVVIGLVMVACGLGALLVIRLWNGTALDTVGEVDFANRLTIPPLAQSRLDDRGRRVFDLTADEGSHDFGSAGTVATWGFNGDYLGPDAAGRPG